MLNRIVSFIFVSGFLSIASTSAQAIDFSGFLGSVGNFGGTQNGQCVAGANASLFTLTMTSGFTGNTNDSGGRDFYDFYLVDGENTIIDGNNGSVSSAGGTVNMNILNVQTFVTPSVGPFRFIIVDTTVNAQTQADGATFNQTVGAQVTVDLSLLNPFCPGPVASDTTGTTPEAIARRIAAGHSKTAVNNLFRHLSNMTRSRSFTGGGFRSIFMNGAQGGSTGITGGGDQHTAYNAAAEDLRPERRNRTIRNYGLDSNRDVLAALVPHVSFDTAGMSGQSLAGLFGARANATPDGAAPTTPPGLPVDGPRTDTRFNIWLNGNLTRMKNSRNNTGDDQRFDGDMLSVSFGADYRISQEWLAGLFLSYSDTELTVQSTDGTYDEIGYTVSPYVSYTPMPWLDLTAVAGVTMSDIDQETNISTGSSTRSNNDALAGFLSLNAKARGSIAADPNLHLTGSAGLIRTIREDGSYTDSSNTFTDSAGSNTASIQVGIEVGYLIELSDTTGLEPYFTAETQTDFLDKINNDTVSGELGGGVRFLDQVTRLQFDVSGTTVVGHDDYSSSTLSGSVSYGFDSNLFGGGEVTPSLTFSSTMLTMRTETGVRFIDDTQKLELGVMSYLNAADPYGQSDRIGDGDTGLRLSARFKF